MYIAYSALQSAPANGEQLPKPDNTQNNNHELQLRYQAYQATCSKYRREIAAIQQYLPNWQPKFY